MRYKSKTEPFEDTEFVRRGDIENKQRDQQLAAMRVFIKIVSEAIYEAGPAGIPSGHLYAAMAGKVSLDTYQYAIDVLKAAGAVTEQLHLLRWSGRVDIQSL